MSGAWPDTQGGLPPAQLSLSLSGQHPCQQILQLIGMLAGRDLRLPLLQEAAVAGCQPLRVAGRRCRWRSGSTRTGRRGCLLSRILVTPQRPMLGPVGQERSLGEQGLAEPRRQWSGIEERSGAPTRRLPARSTCPRTSWATGSGATTIPILTSCHGSVTGMGPQWTGSFGVCCTACRQNWRTESSRCSGLSSTCPHLSGPPFSSRAASEHSC
jgi:hypothetical protein